MKINRFFYYFLCFYVTSTNNIDPIEFNADDERPWGNNKQLSRLKIIMELVKTWPELKKLISKFNFNDDHYNKAYFWQYVQKFIATYNNIVEQLNEMHFDISKSSFVYQNDEEYYEEQQLVNDEDKEEYSEDYQGQMYKYHMMDNTHFEKEILSNYINTIRLINTIQTKTLSFFTLFINENENEKKIHDTMEWQNMSISDMIKHLYDFLLTFQMDEHIDQNLRNRIFNNQLNLPDILEEIIIYLKDKKINGYECHQMYGVEGYIKYVYFFPTKKNKHSRLLNTLFANRKRDDINQKHQMMHHIEKSSTKKTKKIKKLHKNILEGNKNQEIDEEKYDMSQQDPQMEQLYMNSEIPENQMMHHIENSFIKEKMIYYKSNPVHRNYKK